MRVDPYRESEAYIGTFDLKDQSDLATIRYLRNLIMRHNKCSSQKGSIAIRGRLGENNPNAFKYRVGPKREYNTYRNIKLEDAAHADVYIYDKKT